MRKFIIFLLLCLCGCGPDLIPVSNMAGFCEIDEENGLIVNVKNQGKETCTETVTRVEFDSILIDRATGVLAPGEVDQLSFPIPRGCWNPDCGFKITVDVNNQVSEDVESNNIVIGNCVG